MTLVLIIAAGIILAAVGFPLLMLAVGLAVQVVVYPVVFLYGCVRHLLRPKPAPVPVSDEPAEKPWAQR